MKRKAFFKVIFRFLVVVSVVSLLSFLGVYLVIKQHISEIEQHEVESAIGTVKQAVASSSKTSLEMEKLLHERLLAASKGIAKELKSYQLEEITTAQLQELTNKYELANVSLFVQAPDDIVVAKSSDPKEIGLSSKNWGYWYTAFQQLFAEERVSVKRGYYSENYWAGPVSISEVNDSYYVYAYYYDNELPFLLNPYIEIKDIDKLYLPTGPSRLIKELTDKDSHIKEVAVLNVERYLTGGDKKVIEPKYDLPVLYGEVSFTPEQDKAIIEEVWKTGIEASHTFEKGGVDYRKFYVPLPEDRLLTIVLNLSTLTQFQDQLFSYLLVLFFISVSIVVLLVYWWAKYYFKQLQAEKERLAIAEEFKQTIEVLPNAIYKFEKDEKGRIFVTYHEGALGEHLHLSTEDVYGKTVEQVYPEAAAKIMYSALKRAFTGEKVEFQTRILNRIFQHIVNPVQNEKFPHQIKQIAGFATDVTERVEAEKEITQLAYYDQLTRLPNRTLFYERLSDWINHDTLKKEKIAVLLIDLDRFKLVNDSLGHDVGDVVLKEAADRLNGCLLPNDVLARLGGDEFALLLPNRSKQQEITETITNILTIFEAPFDMQGYQFFITPSIGISLYPEDSTVLEKLLKYADTAMYRAKNRGKNTYQFYQSDMELEALDRITLEKKLRTALEEEQFTLVYQPQYDVEKREVIGMEVLVRWHHPEQGKIPPDQFIPLAEETGLIIQLGEWILKTACMQYKEWRNQGMPEFDLSVNLSPLQFRQKNLIQHISCILEETNMNPTFLTFEITENVSMLDSEYTIKTLQDLSEMGIKISIDDFGTGYSSLNYLRQFSIHSLKIDRSFIADITESHNARSVITLILDLAKSLKLDVIAEGVETEDQLRYLQEKNCPYLQGYFISKPLEAEEFFRFFRSFTEKII